MALIDHAERAPVTGKKWAVTAGHPLAAEAADAVLTDGGTLVDAMIAGSAVLTVVCPQATTLGGDGAMLVRRRDGTIDAYDGAGWAMGTEANHFDAAAFAKGPRACVVPGLVDLWRLALADHGSMALDALLAPAIKIARDGAPIGKELHKYLIKRRKDFGNDPFYDVMFPGIDEGSTRFAQPAVAATLENLAAQGLRAFYEGGPAAALRAFLAGLGHEIPQNDFADYQAARVPALSAAYDDWSVAAMPPPFVGLLVLLQMQALAAVATDDVLERRFTHHPALTRQIFAQWTGEIRDVWAEGADADNVRARAAAVLAGRATPLANDHVADGGDTAGLTIVLADGQAASLLQSIFQPFGSRLCDPETGILLNNRMLCFDANGANKSAQRRRPFHTLNPMIVTAAETVIACCSPGGISQTTTCAQVLDAVLAQRVPLDRAVDMDRWSVSRGSAHILEDGPDGQALGKDVRHAFDEIAAPGASFYFGSFKIALKEGKILAAIADQRREAASRAQ